MISSLLFVSSFACVPVWPREHEHRDGGHGGDAADEGEVAGAGHLVEEEPVGGDAAQSALVVGGRGTAAAAAGGLGRVQQDGGRVEADLGLARGPELAGLAVVSDGEKNQS